MPRVPDQPIAREIEDAVQCQAQFDDAQIRSEMGRPRAQQIAQHLANLFRQLIQFGDRHVVQLLADSICESNGCITFTDFFE